jgi:very-short-patch-repair endonuclease
MFVMQKPSSDLLQSLESKLKSANIRSPYLRATIGRSRNRVDFESLNLLADPDESFVTTFLGQLMNAEKGGEIELTLQVRSKNAAQKTEEQRFQMDVLMKRLQSIHFDQEEDFVEHGTRSFGFGYPLIALRSKQDRNRVLLAPLIIWSMDIAPLPNNHHAYTIRRGPDHPISINPQLSAFLSNDYGLNLEKIPDEMLENDCLTRGELAELVRDYSNLLNATHVQPEEGIVSIRDLDYYTRMMDDQPMIYESGILTLFKSNKESIAEDYTKMIQGLDDMMFDNPDLYQPYQKDYFSAVPLDPSQESILRNIAEHKQVIIQGPPGTGKSNSLTGIIINALENSSTVLVVCEKKTALDVIFENLKEKGLDDLCAVLDNVTSDRQKMVRAMRDRFDERKYEKGGTESFVEYNNSKTQFEEFYQRIQLKYGNILTKVMGDLSWKDCIANFLSAQRNATSEKELIWTNELPDLSVDTFFKGLNSIKEAVRLYPENKEAITLFDDFSDHLFVRPLSTSGIRDLQGELTEMKDRIHKIAKGWKGFLSPTNITSLHELQHPGFFLKLKLIFNASLKSQQVQLLHFMSDAQEIAGAVERLSQKHGTVSILSPQELNDWLLNVQQWIDAVVEEMGALSNYYVWRHFFVNRESDVERWVLKGLAHIDANLWESNYRKWFFNELLMSKELDLIDFPVDEHDLNNIALLDGKIDRQQCGAIREIWYHHQRNSMNNRTLQSVRMVFNLRANKRFGKRTSLRHLMHDELDLITSFFPVILVNPSVCSSIFPLKPGLFDVVIFDEASQLRLEDTFPALLRGRFQIVSGDIHQMPPSTHFSGAAPTNSDALEDLEDDVVYAEEESLLTYAQNSNFEFNYLDFHYRSQHPHLIDFSNAAFYNQRLVPMPPTYHDRPIEMREVGGVYADNSNEHEANEIMKYLFEELQPDEAGNYPSVGVATFNMTQQRFLWEKIWKLADADEDIRQKLAALESAGFFIKNLENIQGDQRDIIIISTTFGVRPDGRFIQNFGPINQEKGYKLLNVIVTRAKQKIILVTSIPSEVYSNFRSDIMTRGNTGKGIFYAYLNYARFCSEGNETARTELLEFLLQDKLEDNVTVRKDPANFLTESPFEEEVLNELLQFLPEEQIVTQFQLGGFRLDFAIKNRNLEPEIIIECDGKTYHSSKVAYRYDLHRQRIIERHGLKVYRIWSTNWWRNKDAEVAKLKRYLEIEMSNNG